MSETSCGQVCEGQVSAKWVATVCKASRRHSGIDNVLQAARMKHTHMDYHNRTTQEKRTLNSGPNQQFVKRSMSAEALLPKVWLPVPVGQDEPK